MLAGARLSSRRRGGWARGLEAAFPVRAQRARRGGEIEPSLLMRRSSRRAEPSRSIVARGMHAALNPPPPPRRATRRGPIARDLPLRDDRLGGRRAHRRAILLPDSTANLRQRARAVSPAARVKIYETRSLAAQDAGVAAFDSPGPEPAPGKRARGRRRRPPPGCIEQAGPRGRALRHRPRHASGLGCATMRLAWSCTEGERTLGSAGGGQRGDCRDRYLPLAGQARRAIEGPARRARRRPTRVAHGLDKAP